MTHQTSSSDLIWFLVLNATFIIIDWRQWKHKMHKWSDFRCIDKVKILFGHISTAEWMIDYCLMSDEQFFQLCDGRNKLHFHEMMMMMSTFIVKWNIKRVRVLVFNATQQYFSHIMVVSFIVGGNQSTWIEPPTCRKLQTVSHNVVSSTPSHERDCRSNYHMIMTARTSRKGLLPF